MIHCEGLTKRYGDTMALNGVDLDVASGSILGMLGPNGAGKTTAVRILTTLALPNEGHARVAGFDVVSQASDVQKNIGVVAQDATVDELLTGRQNLIMIGRLSGLARLDAKRRAYALLEEFDLSDAGGRVLKNYSGGMRVVAWTSPPGSSPVHPSSSSMNQRQGLDPTSRVRMWEIISDLVSNGVTLLLTTQYLDEADEPADQIVVVDHGRVIANGTPGRTQDEGWRRTSRGDAQSAQ